MTTGREFARTRWSGSSSVSTPTARIRVLARIPGWGCRSPNRSSRPMADASGRRTARARQRRGRAGHRRRALRGPAARTMTSVEAASVHASAVLVGDRAVLIRGPSGAGKSRLAFDLILAGRAGQIPAGVLVGDDRVHLEASGGQLRVRPARATGRPDRNSRARNLQLRLRRPRPSWAWWSISAAADAERLPPPEALRVQIDGIEIPRIPVGIGYAPLPLVIAALTMTAISSSSQPSGDCPKGIGNHISPTLATE